MLKSLKKARIPFSKGPLQKFNFNLLLIVVEDDIKSMNMS